MERVPYLGESLVRWNVGQSTFLALPEHGARLMHWNVRLGDGSVRDVIHWPESGTIAEAVKSRGGNPILFPFCARSFDRGEIHFWRGPDGVRRPMPMHGIARQGRFELVRADANGFAATLKPDEEARAAYPFDYEFTVVYRFKPLGLSCEFILENKGDQALPWSAGHHFYFSVPWEDGKTRGDYCLRSPATKTLRQDARGQLHEGPKLKREEPLSNPELIDTFHLGLKSNEMSVRPCAEADHGVLTVRNGLDAVPDASAAFVTWTETDASPFYCIEPWMGPANSPETRLGLHWVPPGKTGNYVVEVAIA